MKLVGAIVTGLAFLALLAACVSYESADAPQAPDAGAVVADATTETIGDAPAPPPDAQASTSCDRCRSRHCQPNGGCDPLVFVTEAVVKGDLGGKEDVALAGLARADALCQQESGGQGVFRAWLSDDTTSALTHVQDGVMNRPLWLPDGVMVAESLQTLLADQKPLHAIDRTAKQLVLADAGRVWTGTQVDGAKATFHCQGWTTSSPVNSGSFGELGASTAWTAATVPLTRSCSEDMHLYCFEIVER